MVEARAFASAFHANEADPSGWNKSEMRTLVKDIEHQIAEEELEADGQ